MVVMNEYNRCHHETMHMVTIALFMVMNID